MNNYSRYTIKQSVKSENVKNLKWTLSEDHNDKNMTKDGETGMESIINTQYYINMSPDEDVCSEEGDYASVSSNPRYSIGGIKKLLLHSPPPEKGGNFQESQDQMKCDDEDIYAEPDIFKSKTDANITSSGSTENEYRELESPLATPHQHTSKVLEPIKVKGQEIDNATFGND